MVKYYFSKVGKHSIDRVIFFFGGKKTEWGRNKLRQINSLVVRKIHFLFSFFIFLYIISSFSIIFDHFRSFSICFDRFWSVLIGFDANAKIYILAILGDAALCWDISLGRFVANLPAIAGELASETKYEK